MQKSFYRLRALRLPSLLRQPASHHWQYYQYSDIYSHHCGNIITILTLIALFKTLP